MALDPVAEDGMRGRCWRMTTKLTTGSLSCAPDHHFRNPALLAWETWTFNLRLCGAHLKNGKEHLVDGSLEQQHILANWPLATEVKKDAFANRISKFAASPTIPLSPNGSSG